MISIDVKYIWAKRLHSILKTGFFTTVQTFKLDFLENMKSADIDGTFLQSTVEICVQWWVHEHYHVRNFSLLVGTPPTVLGS